jgi:hypothetical protein
MVSNPNPGEKYVKYAEDYVQKMFYFLINHNRKTGNSQKKKKNQP